MAAFWNALPLLVLSLPFTGNAATIKLDINGSGDYTSFVDAFDNAVDGDTIEISPGTYTETDRFFVNRNLTITAPEGGVNIVPAYGTPIIFDCFQATLHVSNLVYDGSHARNFLQAEECEVTLDNVIVSRSGYGTPTMITWLSTINITGSRFDRNVNQSTSPNQPAVLRAEDQSTVTIEDTEFYLNESQQGPGVLQILEASSASITNSQLYSNVSTNSTGAVYVHQGSSLTVENSTFSANDGATSGGILCTEDSTCLIGRTVFDQNTSNGDGGAVTLHQATAQIENSIFYDQTAGVNGGVIAATASAAEAFALTLNNNHFLSNAATGDGQVLHIQTTPTSSFDVYNNLFGFSTGSTGSVYVDTATYGAAASATLEHNLYYGNSGGDSNITLDQSEISGSDPLLHSYTQGATVLNTLFPDPGSPLIDAGRATVTDADGTISDIGAFGGPNPNQLLDEDQDGFIAADDCDDRDSNEYPDQSWYPDADGDGYGDETLGEVVQCEAPADHAPNNQDCDDTNPDIFPFTSWYEDKDGDGYGQLFLIGDCEAPNPDAVYVAGDCDDDDPEVNPTSTWYPDTDGDSYGDNNDPGTVGCNRPATNYVLDNTDCDDGDDTESPLATWYADADGDGYGDLNSTSTCERADASDVSDNTDCDDGDPDEYPGVEWHPDADGDGFGDPNANSSSCERAASTDTTDTTDCDDSDPDENPDVTWYADADADGFGDPSEPAACERNQSDDTVDNTDCDDTDPTENPNVIWYRDNDGDGYGSASNASVCERGDPTDVHDYTDCDDYDDRYYPGVIWYADSDGDGYGDPNSFSECLPNEEHRDVLNADDCDDSNEEYNPTVVWYADEDGDSYGDPNSFSICAPNDPSSDVTNYDDCDDNDPLEKPYAVWHPDADGDGYGNPNIQSECSRSSSTDVLDFTDCDDNDAEEFPGQVWYTDSDGDGFGDPNRRSECVRSTALDVAVASDCDDRSALIYPGADSLCDGVINDCDATALEPDEFDNDQDGYVVCTIDITGWKGDTKVIGGADCDDENPYWAPDRIWFQDLDGDGYGRPETGVVCAPAHPNDTQLAGDCDDTRIEARPGAPELCNGVVDNCDEELSVDELDVDGDGFVACDGTGTSWLGASNLGTNDCDDNDASTFPYAPEYCDNLDNDCDNFVDESASDVEWFLDADGDGFGESSTSQLSCDSPGDDYVRRGNDCDDTDRSRHPRQTELCDGIDNNCDGLTDNDPGNGLAYYIDADSDGYGDPTSIERFCTPPAGRVEDDSDCNDNDPTINPDGEEVCNGADDNCNGRTDEEAPDATAHYLDRDLDGYGDAEAEPFEMCPGTIGFVDNNEDCDDYKENVYPAATEFCDLSDNDCNGLVDDNVVYSDWYPDLDQDGYGDASSSAVNDCIPPEGHVLDNTDCHDDIRWANPGVSDEIYYDDVDQNCDGASDHDADLDGYDRGNQPGEDCNDTDPDINPGASEIPDNDVDDDCDGEEWVTLVDSGETGDTAETGDTGPSLPKDEGCACNASTNSLQSVFFIWFTPLLLAIRRRRPTAQVG